MLVVAAAQFLFSAKSQRLAGIVGGMSNIDDVNQSPEPPADSSLDTGEPKPAAGQAPDTGKRELLVRSLTIAGAAAAVVAVLVLTFGAGVWAGSEFGDDYGRDGHGHSESRSHDHDDADRVDDGDERRNRDSEGTERHNDHGSKPNDGDRGRADIDSGGRSVTPPSIVPSPVAPIPAPPAAGRA